MSDRQKDSLTPDEKRARDAVRSMPRVTADPGFKVRLKTSFVSGQIDPESERRRQTRAPRRWLSRPGIWAPVGVAAALAIVLVMNRGPSLELADVTGVGTVTVDGRAFETTDRAGLERWIKPGSRIALSEGVEIDVVYRETIVYQFAAAEATVPRAPARWFGKTAECRLDNGEVRLLTGPGFQGARLEVTTPEGIIHVTGSLVSVFRDESGTCVCIHAGTASVGIDTDDLESIPTGKRKVMFADGKDPIITDIAPPHKEHLIEFETKYRSGIR
jgi:ferric-dicitrate binding protein FerR (iron transport regulator)